MFRKLRIFASLNLVVSSSASVEFDGMRNN